MKKILLGTSCLLALTASIYAQDAKPLNHKDLKKLAIANKKDPVCNMPTRISLEDTTIYKGDIIGFCSHECKNKFVKNPSAYTIGKK